MLKTKLKKGDNVKVMTGKSKGHIGRIISMQPAKGVAFVEGANMVSLQNQFSTPRWWYY